MFGVQWRLEWRGMRTPGAGKNLQRSVALGIGLFNSGERLFEWQPDMSVLVI